MKKAIEQLQKYASDGKNEDMACYEEILAENLEVALKFGVFFSIPLANICSVVKKSKTQNLKIIIDVILGLYESGHKNIPVLLEYLDLPELKLNECIHIISLFKSSPICVRTGNIYEEYSFRPEIDWNFAVSEKEKEISKLKSEIEAKQKEITNYNKIKNENQREITNLNGKIKDMQNEIIKLQSSNDKKQKEISNLSNKIRDGQKEITTTKLLTNKDETKKEDQIEYPNLNSKITDIKNEIAKLFKYDGNKKFSGIIKYFSIQCGGNVADQGIIRVEATSTYLNYYPRNVLLEVTNSFWLSKDEQNSWVKFDFIDMKVLLEAYSICAAYLRSFKLECSNDGKNWVQIDTRNDVQALNGNPKSETFTISTTTPFRFFRFTQTDRRWQNNDDFFLIYQIEFFGSLIQ